MILPLIAIDTLPLSAASGLVELREALWTVADDETVLVGSTSVGAWNERVVLVLDRLPADPVDRKRRKPDFEAIAVLPDERLFVLGSGSTPSRRRGVVVDLRARVPGVIDLTPLFLALEEQIPELNLEGAVVHGNALFLAQRGNGASAGNALVRLDLSRVLASMARTPRRRSGRSRRDRAALSNRRARARLRGAAFAMAASTSVASFVARRYFGASGFRVG